MFQTGITRIISCLCLSTLLFGCADSFDGRQAVSGKITVGGKPFTREALIAFEPLSKQDTRGGVALKDGTYVLLREHGLKPGKYLARLSAPDGKTPANDEGGNPGGSTNIVSLDLIPEAFGSKSKQEIEVKVDSPNTFDFDLPYLVDPKNRKRR